MKIIIVDDHVLFREGLAAMIRPEPDMEVAGMAGSVQESVEMVRLLKPDLILMDFFMPDGTGADATGLILSQYPECKILFLTMSEDDENLFAAIRSGAKGYLLKNVRPAKLLAAIRAVEQGESALSPSMTLRLMSEFSRTSQPKPANDLPEDKLTQREIQVLRLVAGGRTNQEIADQLFLSENTIKYHMHTILRKLNLSDRKEAAVYAREHDIV